MRVGIIGAGSVGTTLGNAFVRAGHEVVYGSRDDTKTAPHAGALLGTIPGAVLDSEIIILATPFAAAESVLAEAGDFDGKILVDATNPIGPNLELVVSRTTSGAERVATFAKRARVVKCFNTVGHEIMANPKFGAQRALMLACGDDDDATRTTAKLATSIGFEGVALAGLARARDLEPLAVLWIMLAMQLGHGRNFALGLAQRDKSGASADATVNLTAVGAAPFASPRVVTLLGAGNIGGGLARAWIRAGHDVRLAVRDSMAPDVLDLVEQGARAIPIEGSAKGTDVLAIAIPASAVVEALKCAGDLAGAILVDCTNGIGPQMMPTAPAGSSGAEQMAALAVGARVVRAFNQQGAETLRDARFDDQRAVSFVAGDDEAARQIVLSLSNDVGLDSIDAGPLSTSRLLDHVTMVWISISKAIGSREIGLTLLRR
jgi:predicted dinucleotide-binding enzyme